MMYERQNEMRSLKLLKASVYCTRVERALKALPILLSIAVCVIGIFNQYNDFISPIWLAGLAGLVLVVDAVLMSIARWFQNWSASLMDIYDHHVYGIPSNKLMTKHMSQIAIDQYSSRVNDKDGTRFKNFYFDARVDSSSLRSCPVFENQKRQFVEEHNLLAYCRKYMYIIWIGFLVGLLVIASTFGDTFLNSIVNIFVPSLGIIVLIVNSWIGFEENLRDLKHCTDNLEKKRVEFAKGQCEQNLNSPQFLRSVQDGVFKFRSQNVTVPSILVWMYNRAERRKAKRKAYETNSTAPPRANTKRRIPPKKKPAPKPSKPRTTTTPPPQRKVIRTTTRVVRPDPTKKR